MIKVNMPMPRTCEECPISYFFKYECPYGSDDGAGHDMFYSYVIGKRPIWCPIQGEAAHSRWVYNEGDYVPYCENCLMPSDTETKYCASCGAIMDGKGNI